MSASALIVQNKGGGHGELGFQLAKTLQSNYQEKITSITILQDDKCNDEQEPFQSYKTDIPDVKIIKTNLSSSSSSDDDDDEKSITAESLQSILGGDDVSYDYIWDNASKDAKGVGKAICDCAKSWDSTLLCYVSSAGMYQPSYDKDDDDYPMPETTPVKYVAGQNQYEMYAVELDLPLVSFRPQYIYGPKSNKYDYIDFYFDRLVRELPIPIPGDGTQKVSLTNSVDVASLLASVLGNEDAAKNQRFFNCGTDKLVTYTDVAYLCAEAAGIPKEKVAIEYYEADIFGKANFPFRTNNFYITPDTAKDKLNWSGPTHTLDEDLKQWYLDGYKARGGPEKKMNLMKDFEIVVGSKSSFELGSIYDKFDDFQIDTSNVKALNAD